jgi:hypothetical protein
VSKESDSELLYIDLKDIYIYPLSKETKFYVNTDAPQFTMAPHAKKVHRK